MGTKRNIQTVDARSKLAARRTPYWMRLERGISIGFRKLTAASTGTWLARVYDAATRKDTWHGLGGFEDLPAHDRFTAAKKAAEALGAHVARGGATERATVADVCRRYVEHLRLTKGQAAADDAQARFGRYVLRDERLAQTEVRKLSAAQVTAWRRGLQALPTAAGNARTDSTLNRDMTCFRAALNLALEDQLVTSALAWDSKLRPIPGADGRRTIYLDKTQRAALIAQAPADLAAFLRGLALLPLRPGALAALTVASFDRRLSTLAIGEDKAGADRVIKLPESTAAFFAEQVKGKLPGAPLLARADGAAWDKDMWKKPIKAAADAAGLPAATTAYTLRHSTITDLVSSGLDVLTVARMSGTSMTMIDRHYGHLVGQHGAAALATLAV